jgi:hypothetical protein
MNPYLIRSTKSAGFIFFWVCFLVLPLSVYGEAYHPLEPLHILSKYRTSGSSGPSQTLNWIVSTEDLPTYRTLDFFLPGGQKPLCTLMLSLEKHPLKIEWQALGERKQRVFETLMVLPDFPAPCDILPSVSGENTQTFKTRREAGGRWFVTTYRVVRQEVDLQEVLRQGWVHAGVKIQGPFYFLKVLDSSGDMVLRQLWEYNGNWWLYEESRVSGRQSWRIEGEE